MKLRKVLLIENTKAQAELLTKKLSDLDSLKFMITTALTSNGASAYNDCSDRLDAVLFGEKVPPKAILQLTKAVRTHNSVIPIFLLSRQSEARVSRKYRIAGIDDVLNVAEIETPLFTWTFMSAVEHAVLKKKAKEYDVLNHRIKLIGDSLATLVHDINNPLSVIRLAIYHLENPKLSIDKKETFLRLLVNNVERLDVQMKELRTIRMQLHGNREQTANILSLKPPLNLTATK